MIMMLINILLMIFTKVLMILINFVNDDKNVYYYDLFNYIQIY